MLHTLSQSSQGLWPLTGEQDTPSATDAGATDAGQGSALHHQRPEETRAMAEPITLMDS